MASKWNHSNPGQIASCHRLDGPVWKQIGDMQLRQEEKGILSHRGDWLNDRIMDAAQILLRRQFPYISGLDTVLKAQNLSYDCRRNNPFIRRRLFAILSNTDSLLVKTTISVFL